MGPKRPLEQGLNIKPTWDPSMCTKCYFLQYETPLREKPDRTRTGSVALSTEFVRGRLVENVEALCCAVLCCAALHCAVLCCSVLFCSVPCCCVMFLSVLCVLRCALLCGVLCCVVMRCAVL